MSKAKLPRWMTKQAEKLPSRYRGFASNDSIDAPDVAREVLGERANVENAPLMQYLYRRFGPTAWGSDGHKEVAAYILTTPNRAVFVEVRVQPYSVADQFGLILSRRLFDQMMKEYFEVSRKRSIYFMEYKGRDRAELLPVATRVRDALAAAILDLTRPVFVRDAGINCFGRVPDDECVRCAPRSKYAGLGVPVAAMEAMLAEGDEGCRGADPAEHNVGENDATTHA